jgi:carboxyl-terminal processing protease
MKERARATILGAQSLGKGSVQELIKLPDGGFLKVTVGYYVGPSGRRLDEGGVRPDRWLAKPQGRTVLQGADPQDDAWVMSAVDVLKGPLRADSGARAFGPMP